MDKIKRWLYSDLYPQGAGAGKKTLIAVVTAVVVLAILVGTAAALGVGLAMVKGGDMLGWVLLGIVAAAVVSLTAIYLYPGEDDQAS